MELTGRHIRHTMLLHHNLAAAMFPGDVIKMFREKEWNIISAHEGCQERYLILTHPGHLQVKVWPGHSPKSAVSLG